MPAASSCTHRHNCVCPPCEERRAERRAHDERPYDMFVATVAYVMADAAAKEA